MLSARRGRETSQSPPKRQFNYDDEHEVAVDATTLRQLSPSKRAAEVLRQTSSKYPELDQATQIENYRKEVSQMELSEAIRPIELKSKKTSNAGKIASKVAQKAETRPY